MCVIFEREKVVKLKEMQLTIETSPDIICLTNKLHAKYLRANILERWKAALPGVLWHEERSVSVLPDLWAAALISAVV